ncbi:MAG: shikimate dehydrogenase [Campylobacteraceae bacterium]|jgi:shikimate dehydrogenase|nr:shikimate dehydrogenase [Campylobacteraceae bacterium]
MKNFCVFGNPIEHSISPRLHNEAFKAFGIDANYTKILLENADELKEYILRLKLDGANITVPYKETAFKICDEVFGIAKKIEAVNTITRKNDKLFGFNTDALGFLKAIQSFGKIENALILGAGGTAKAIMYILSENKIGAEILNRSKERIEFFKQKQIDAFCWDDYEPKKYDLIINTTSAGLRDENLPAPKELLAEILKNAKFGFDVIYNKQTPFLKLCEENLLLYKDGSDMLLYQALFAFNIFFDNAYDETKIAQAMRKSLSAS